MSYLFLGKAQYSAAHWDQAFLDYAAIWRLAQFEDCVMLTAFVILTDLILNKEDLFFMVCCN